MEHGNLALKDDGWVYISERGIEYEILEGVSLGANKRYTSDLIFIVLMDADYNVDNLVVDYLFGASCFERNPKDYEESIRELVNEFEKRNFENIGG